MVDVRAGQEVKRTNTKVVFDVEGEPDLLLMVCTDDLTIRNGERREQVPGRGRAVVDTICDVYRFLEACGVKTAFVRRVDEVSYLVKRCDMIPYRFVCRREAHGSFLKRYPIVPRGTVFPRIVEEVFLRTFGTKFEHEDVGCCDPLVRTFSPSENDVVLHLFNPEQPIGNPIKTLRNFPLHTHPLFPGCMKDFAQHIFYLLERAWQLAGKRLIDLKVEFGFDSDRRLVVADAIEADTWRIADPVEDLFRGFRDGATVDEAYANLQVARSLVSQFKVPQQRIVLWRGSEKDDLCVFDGGLNRWFPRMEQGFRIEEVTCSMHKEPARALRTLGQLSQKYADSVIIAYIGLSNGAGPILAANCTLPVIAVPATFGTFPEDVYSSLRLPSDVPLSVILNPTNAVHQAAMILGARNPIIYARLRADLEFRLELSVAVM